MGSLSEGRWHVRIAPDEVKILTLEQVDDLFRLDMIDENTLLWQEGMGEWLPLRVVAGLDDDSSAPAAPAPARPAPSAPPPPPRPSAPPVRAKSTAPPPPPPPLPPPSARVSGAPSPFSPSPSFAPPPASTSRMGVPAPSVPVPSAPAPSVQPVGVAVSAPAPSFAPVPALGVAPLTSTSAFAPQRASRLELALIALAALLGLVVIVQRDGALAALFESAGQASTYASLESSLGGPGFGTPRAVQALLVQSSAVPASWPEPSTSK